MELQRPLNIHKTFFVIYVYYEPIMNIIAKYDYYKLYDCQILNNETVIKISPILKKNIACKNMQNFFQLF